MLKSLVTATVAAVLIFVVLPCTVVAQSPVGAPMVSPAASPAPDCLMAVTNVSDCLTYVQVGSNLTAPDKPCCPEFAGLLESNPICLCQLIGDPDSLGIDISRALKLPSICNVPIPSLSSCPAGSGAPVPAPSQSEAPGSSASTIPDGGAAAGPASGNGSSAALSIAISGLSSLVCLAVASFAVFLLI